MPFKPLAVVALMAAATALVAAPAGWGLPTGMDKDVQGYPANFQQVGCTASGCHGGQKFAAGGLEKIRWNITDASGHPLAGNAYTKSAVYTINVTLLNEQAPDKEHHAGFNLQASAGKLDVLGDVQVSKDQTQATHSNADHTHWSVKWTAPDSGAVAFNLFVNDVNGEKGADPGDMVYRAGFWLTDAQGAQVGAAAAAGEVQYGISLQQYWIGLIGLAGMIFIMVAGYVFLKYGSRHNTDAKDR
jgi:hypothetical protein